MYRLSCVVGAIVVSMAVGACDKVVSTEASTVEVANSPVVADLTSNSNASSSNIPFFLPPDHYVRTRCKVTDNDPGHCCSVGRDVSTKVTFEQMAFPSESDGCSTEEFAAASGWSSVLEKTIGEYADDNGMGEERQYLILCSCSREVASEVRALVMQGYQ